MPVYTYRNLATGETFEYEQRMADDALTVHPETGEPVKRLIQPVGIVFKGSGFYINDSRSGGGSGHSSEKSGSAPKESTSAPAPSTAAASASAD